MLCFVNKSIVNAEVAHLVEHDLAKVGVAGSSPVFRSKSSDHSGGGFFVVMPWWWNLPAGRQVGRQVPNNIGMTRNGRNDFEKEFLLIVLYYLPWWWNW